MGTEINNLNCLYCNKFFYEELWCRECDPQRLMQGWTSGNPIIDKCIKDTMYKAALDMYLEWVPFDKFTDIEKIGQGGFSEVYSATWLTVRPLIFYYGKTFKVVLKKLNGSRNISDRYITELFLHWNLYKHTGLRFFGLTKDPETNDFMMIMQYAEYGNFGLCGPANEQNPDNKVYGVLPYVAPEVLNKEPFTTSADVYSFGVIMAELSSGKPPFHNKRHDFNLALAICDGHRPEFGRGTPEFYKKLAYKCMNANPNERPTTQELFDIINIWRYSMSTNRLYYGREFEKFDNIKEVLKADFEKANEEIPNISTSFETDPDAVYTSRELTFDNPLPRPVNSSIITSYINNDEIRGSQMLELSITQQI
ncbi:kinase-like protein [Rhizophagus irregularis]|uniref:Kinase-like protein n=1 Tax=Rhizophagus irregularis TaxID=588596 RepID=A0A2I1FB40_9GLOM|nr:kinase-like protein [Rhizophagus irregularis]PKY31609.1 kinase-like protein [Rhizophagus irregularis]